MHLLLRCPVSAMDLLLFYQTALLTATNSNVPSKKLIDMTIEKAKEILWSQVTSVVGGVCNYSGWRRGSWYWSKKFLFKVNQVRRIFILVWMQTTHFCDHSRTFCLDLFQRPQNSNGLNIFISKLCSFSEREKGALHFTVFFVREHSGRISVADPLWSGEYPLVGLSSIQIIEKCNNRVPFPTCNQFRWEIEFWDGLKGSSSQQKKEKKE